LLKVEER